MPHLIRLRGARTRRLPHAALLGVLAALAAPGAALADSLVFIKAGDVWLANADGSGQVRVTEGGRYRSPSMADDGTIVASHGAGELVRMRQNGDVLSRFAVIGSGPNSGTFEGPFDPQISPDGTAIAYWFLQRTSWYDPACNCLRIDTRPHATITAADRFTDPTGREAGAYRAPSWIGRTNRLLVADYAQVGTYVAGGDNSALQRWYNDYQRAWAIARLELTRDMSKIVVAHGDVVTNPTRLLLYTTNGQPWTDDGPPYDNFDPSRPRPNPPTVACSLDRGQAVSGVSWSSGGARLAFGLPDGIWIANVPASLADCAAITGGLAIPGASEPDFSPAAVAPGRRSQPGGPGTTPGGGAGAPDGPGRPGGQGPGGGAGDPALRLAGVVLRPATFRATRGSTLRLRLSEPARVTLSIMRGTRVVRRATRSLAAGSRRVRVVTRGLRPGRYRLVVRARDRAGNASPAVTRAFRVVRR